MINQNISANYCLTKTSINNQNKLSFSLKHVFQKSFPSIKYHCTTTTKIENIIMSKPFYYQLMHIMLKCVIFSQALTVAP